HVGHPVSYPDISNTCYGSHSKAAGMLIMDRKHFLGFMDFVCDVKDKPSLTNIEQNFANAL
ncbi:hypothetical protein M413DRAFT_51629, partial [Hebeloma cylindrosporum]